jgi:uncharacterized Zn-binding protein involved in type VI secretion
MAGGVVRMTDPNSCGGMPLNGVASVRVNGIPVVVTGTAVSPHPNYKPPHTSARTISGSPAIRVSGIPIVTASDIDTCGHIRLNASPNVRVG